MRNHKLFVTADSGDSAAPLTEGVAVTGANTYYSKMFSGNEGSEYSVHLEWSGNPAGTLTMWQTDKPNPVETTDADWVEDTTWSPTDPAGSASNTHTDTVGRPALRKRIKYVNSAGSGTLKGWVSVPNV